MRKRLIFETLHLDVEGGVGERRTTPSATTMTTEGVKHPEGAVVQGVEQPSAGVATIEVKLEATDLSKLGANVQRLEVTPKKGKAKKRVAFQSDRPDLYDF